MAYLRRVQARPGGRLKYKLEYMLLDCILMAL